jgi:hypothetical protein
LFLKYVQTLAKVVGESGTIQRPEEDPVTPTSILTIYIFSEKRLDEECGSSLVRAVGKSLFVAET